MDLRLIVIDQATRTRHELTLSARRGTPGRLLTARLREALGREVEFFVGVRPLDDCRWGLDPLADGAVISFGTPTDDDHVPRLVCIEGRGSGGSWRIPRGIHDVGRDADIVRLDNERLPPHAGNLVAGPTGMRFVDPVGNLSASISPETSWEIAGSVLTIAQDNPDCPSVVSQGDIPQAPVQLRPHLAGASAILATSLLPLGLGILMAWLWHYWLMAVFSVGSAATSLVFWLARGGGPAHNRRLLRDAKERELVMIDQFCPSLGTRLAHAHPSLPAAGKVARTEHGLPTDATEAALPWIRWGRGSRPLHVKTSIQATVPQTENLPILSHLKYPHVIVVAKAGRTDGLDILRGHLAVAKIPYTWLTCGQDCATCRIVLARIGPGVSHGLTQGPPLRLACSERSVDREASPHVIVTREERVRHPSPGWSGVLVRPARQGLELSAVGDAEGALLGAAGDDRQFCARPDIPNRELLEALSSMNHQAGSAPRESPRLSAREELTAEEMPARWARNAKDPRLFVDVGAHPTAHDDIRVDMNAHGPHALVAGTTGSGKSELLRGILYRLALSYPPERLGMVLIDFKGGAGFGPAVHLPHVHSCVTDLDGSAIVRALSYLEAEISRREALLDQAEFTSWKDYFFSPSLPEVRPDMPEIVIVVDEFRHLVDTHPTALHRLLRVAAAGRSLGLHLILSTQRPQGAVSQDIRANTSIDICLRVTRDQDSIDLLGTSQAARIPSTTPGRGFVRFDGTTREFQSVLVDRIPTPPPLVPSEPPAPTGLPSSREEAERLLTRETKELAHRAGPRDGRGAPVIPAPLPTPDIGVWKAGAERYSEGPHEDRLLLGPAENPCQAWQGMLSWEPRAQGGLAFTAPAPTQSRFLAALFAGALTREIPVYLCIFDRTIYQHVPSWRARGLDVRALGTPSSFTFAVEILRLLPLQAGTGRGPRPIVAFQGLDRWIDESMRRGVDLIPALEELFSALGKSWFLAALSTTALPQRLAGMIHNQLEMSGSAPTGIRSSPTLDTMEGLSGLCRVDGPIANGRTPVGLSLPHAGSLTEFPRALPLDQDPEGRHHARGDRSWPVFKDLPEELHWPGEPATRIAERVRPAHLKRTCTRDANCGSITVGVAAPWGKECELPWRRGDVIGAVINGPDAQGQFVEVITAFHDADELNIYSPARGVSAPRRHRSASPSGMAGVRIAVITDFAEWDVALQEPLRAIAAAHEATIVLVASSTLVLPQWWTARMNEASCAVVLGPGPLRLPFDRPETTPGDPMGRRRDEGVLLANGASHRFKLPKVTSTESRH